MEHTYDLVNEYHGLAMWKRDDGKYALTWIDRNAGQVYSYLAGDKPAEAGTNWFAGISDYGIDYVAGAYSEGYIRRKFREYVKQYEEEVS